MGIFSALFAGVNGINSNGSVISVIGDNIANVNTIGYKSSRAAFEDILAGSSSNIGLGSRVSNVSPQFNQGGFESSSSVTDMAIDGKGFFVVQATDGTSHYTRAGQFLIDRTGQMATGKGEKLQGFAFDSTTNAFVSTSSNIVISQTPVAPHSSAAIAMQLNLKSGSTAPAAFSSANPSGTSNFSAGVTVYDSLGNGHLVTVYFRKNATNEWQWYTIAASGEITGLTAGANFVGGSGTLSFNSSGALTSAQTAAGFQWAGAASATIAFSFGTGTAAGGTGLTGVTQFGSDSAISNITQDGYSSGTLKSLEISSDGTITGNYTNGQTARIYQVALASFNNQGALTRVGSNDYAETLGSGTAVVSAPGAGGKGTLVSSTLEQSNVDLANELIKMVIIQRGFQANSRTINTVNQLLSELVTLGQ